MPLITSSNLAGSLSLMANMKYKHDARDLCPYSNYEELFFHQSNLDDLSVAATDRFELHKENTDKADQGPISIDSAKTGKGKTEVGNDESKNASKDDSKVESTDASKDDFEGECKDDPGDASTGITEVDKDESNDASNEESKDAFKNDGGARIGLAETDKDEMEDAPKDESRDASKDDFRGECKDVHADASTGVTEVGKDESNNASNEESKGASKNDGGARIGLAESDKDEMEDAANDESRDASKDDFRGECKDVHADASTGVTEVGKDESNNASNDESEDDVGARIGLAESDKDEMEDATNDESKDVSKDEPKGVSKDASRYEYNDKWKAALKEVMDDGSTDISEDDTSDDDDDDGNNDEFNNDAAGPSIGCKTGKRCRGYSDNDKEDSLLSLSLDMENWTEQGLCIKCKKSNQVLTCSANGCWVAVHTSCLGVIPYFDDNGYFYCPLCSYKRVLSELDQVEKEKSMAKEKVRVAKRLCRLFVGSSTEEEVTVHEEERTGSRTDADRTCSGSNSGSKQRRSDEAIFTGLEIDQQEAVVTTGGTDGSLRIETCLESERDVVFHTRGGEVTQDIGFPQRNSMGDRDQHKDIPSLSEFDDPSTRRKETDAEMVDKIQNSKECAQENQVEDNAECGSRKFSCTETVTIAHLEHITQKGLPIPGAFGSPLTQSEEIENEMVENIKRPKSGGQLQVETDVELNERNWTCREAETSKNVDLVETCSTCLRRGKETEKEMVEDNEEHQCTEESEGEMQVESDVELIKRDLPCREAEASIQAEQVLLQSNIDLVGTSCRRKETDTEMVDKIQNSKECAQENQVEDNAECSSRKFSCTEAVTIAHLEHITQKGLPVPGAFSSPLTQSEEIENEMVENIKDPRESGGQMQVETDVEHQCTEESEGEMQVESDVELIKRDLPRREAETSVQAEQVPLQPNIDLLGTSSPYQRNGSGSSRRTKSLASKRTKPLASKRTKPPAKRRAIKLPKPKRNRLFWSVEEEEMLKKGVEKFSSEVKKKMCWRSVLAFGSSVFHTTRTPEDLKDKWRTMTKGRRHK